MHALGAGIAASYSMNQGSIGIGGVVSAASDTFAASTEQLARCALSVGLGSADGVPGCITRFDALNVLTGRSPVVGEEASNLNNPNGIVEEMVDEWFAFLMRIGFDYDQSFL